MTTTVSEFRCFAIKLCLLAVCGSTQVLMAHDGAKYEPPDGAVLHGAGQDPIGFNDYAAALATAAGSDALHPFITKAYFEVYGRYPQLYLDDPTYAYADLLDDTIVPLTSWLGNQTGLMPEISLNFEEYNGVFGDTVIPTGVLDQYIEDLALTIKQFGEPCFVRPGYEPNTLHYTIGQPYIQSFRRIVDIFRANVVDNVAFVWCCGPANGVQMAQEGAWYPGDDYVDWVGVDLFVPEDFTSPSLAAMVALANGWRKPIILSETSAVFAAPPGYGEGGISESDEQAAHDYWDIWFGPFFDVIANTPRIKAFNYINWDWPAHGFPWVDSRIENNPFLVEMIADELSDPRYIHRDTAMKFQRPYLLQLGGTVPEGGAVVVAGENADPHGTGQPSPFVAYYYGLSKITTPSPNPGYLNYTLGVPAFGQYFFIDDPFQQLSPTSVGADGTFSLTLQLPPSGLAGLTFYLQVGLRDPFDNANRLTQPFQLNVVAP